MPTLTLIAIAIFSLCLAVAGFALLVRPDPRRRIAVQLLQRGLARTAVEASGQASGGSSRPDGIAALVRRLTPPRTVQRIDRLLSRAGRPQAWSLQRLLLIKPMLALAFGCLGIVYATALDNLSVMAFGLLGAVVASFVPELLLYSRGLERTQKITLELPDTLDQMTIAVEAGLGFDAAMARTGKNGTGPLAEELVRTLQDIQMGRSRRQAYEALMTRTNAVDLRRFVRAIIQADAHGISIADVLRTQAAEMRMKRRQRAEHKAMQLPVKVIFPLMFCILPVLFIVLLGPVAITALNTFG